MKNKYKHKGWLKSQLELKHNPEDIAKDCGVETVDIYSQIQDFGFIILAITETDRT